MNYYNQNSLARLKSIFTRLQNTVPCAYIPFQIAEDHLIVYDETIRISVANTISEAWTLAYPSYNEKFETDKIFRTIMNFAAGKWLAPQSASDPFWILLAENKFECEDDLLETLSHELRICSDFIRAYHRYSGCAQAADDPDLLMHLQELENSTRQPKFELWSLFNGVYTATAVHFAMDKSDPTIATLCAYLGYQTGEIAEPMLRHFSDTEATDYDLSRYLGVHYAVRDLSRAHCKARIFELGNLLPACILKKAPNADRIANDYLKIDVFEF
jgi:hypothetical protein